MRSCGCLLALAFVMFILLVTPVAGAQLWASLWDFTTELALAAAFVLQGLTDLLRGLRRG